MFKVLATAAALAASLATPAAAQGADVPPELVITEAGEQLLESFLWQARLLVIFADSPNDPRFVQQMGYIADRPEDLLSRDVVVITDTDPSANSPIRAALRPRGFDLVLIGKDGSKYLRKPLPWDVREITRSIDKMPLRQQELRDSRGAM
jgi:Domain of unknown function (DUF4174)